MGVHLSPATKYHVIVDYYKGIILKDIAARYGLKGPQWVSKIVQRAAQPNRYRKKK